MPGVEVAGARGQKQQWPGEVGRLAEAPLWHPRQKSLAHLVGAIAKGRRWLDQIVSGSVTEAEQIAAREGCGARQVNLTLSLAFLAPALVKAAVEGRLPRGINIERLRDPPTEWAKQFEALGLNPQQS